MGFNPNANYEEDQLKESANEENYDLMHNIREQRKLNKTHEGFLGREPSSNIENKNFDYNK